MRNRKWKDWPDEYRWESNRNRRHTRKLLGIYGKTNLVLHHKDTEMFKNDIKRYIQWNPEDLEIMTLSEHTRFHNLIATDERKEKISKTLTGRTHTEEHKKNIGIKFKGKHWKVENGKRVWY